jgi:Flp pilus assembly protein CpaB
VRQRSNLIILFGIAFFLVGGAIVFLVLNDEDGTGGGVTGRASGAAQATVLVASADIPANTLGSDVIEQGLLTTQQVAAGTQPAGALTSAAGLDNQIFAVGVEEGAVVTSAQLATRSLSNVQVPAGFDGVAVTLGYTQAGAGYIAPGDMINVYGVFGPEGDAGVAAVDGNVPVPRTELVLTNVLVLDVSAQQGTSVQTAGQPDQAGQQQTIGRQALDTPLTYLLALRPTDVERVVQLTSFADLYLSLAADDAPTVGDTQGVAGDNVRGPVSADSAAPQP